MALIAGIIGIPMFFEIGLVLLIPVVMLAVHRSKGPAMRLGIPALAGLSVLHGFIPPHPGPLAAIGILHANVGITLALGLLVAIPTVIVAGPLFGDARRPAGARSAPPERGLAVTGRRRRRRHDGGRRQARDAPVAGARPGCHAQPDLRLDPDHPPVSTRADAAQGRSGHLDGQGVPRCGPPWTSSAIRFSHS